MLLIYCLVVLVVGGEADRRVEDKGTELAVLSCILLVLSEA